jgi:RNA polymerase sigma factor (TIGR02999 family)
MSDVTRILNAIEHGDNKASEKLLPLVYDELRRLAAQKMALERPGQTLQATALVHEAYIRLVGEEEPIWESRRHFFAAAAEAMRRILIETARRKKSLKAGGNHNKVDLNNLVVGIESSHCSDDLIALDDALTKLSRKDKVKAELVKLRYFAGLTIDQTAEFLGISPATAKRHWTYARAWLIREIG